MDDRNHLLREYLAMVGKLWGKQISGPILAAISLILGFAAAHYANDAQAGAKLVKYSAWLTGSVSIFLIFVAQYNAWKSERDALETEKQSHVGSDIRGKIKRGYLDIRDYNVKTHDWESIAHGCYVRFWVEAVNHNPCSAFPLAEQTTLEMRIDGKTFRGEWWRTQNWLAVQDRALLGERLTDLFDGRFDPDGWKRGDLWVGYIGFFVKDFDLTDQNAAITADVTITITDTLEKSHTLEGQMPLMVGKICLRGDVAIG